MRRFKNAVHRTHEALEAEKREYLSSDNESDDGNDHNESNPHFLKEMFAGDEVRMWIELFTKYPSLQNISGLHIKLESATESWMERFLEQGGLESVIELLHTLSMVRYAKDLHHLNEAVVYLACINCLKAVMKKNKGLEYLCESCSPEVTSKILLGKCYFVCSYFVFFHLHSPLRTSYKNCIRKIIMLNAKRYKLETAMEKTENSNL